MHMLSRSSIETSLAIIIGLVAGILPGAPMYKSLILLVVAALLIHLA
jgi:divalent metal cation (Fe/Co/Zn/Cd) transporter